MAVSSLALIPARTSARTTQLATLEREVPDPATVKLVRAAWWGADPRGLAGPAALPAPWATREADVRALLTEAALSPSPGTASVALARLAEREFADRSSWSSALAHYREYARRFASADQAWVASLRAAQVEYAMRRHADAAASFIRTADAYPVVPR